MVKVPTSEIGMAITGMSEGAPSLQEKEDYGHDEQDRNEDRLHHLANRLRNDGEAGWVCAPAGQWRGPRPRRLV
jgi:hypothetical protein